VTEVLVRVIDAYVYSYESNKLSFLLLKRSRKKIYEYLWQGVAGKIEKNELAWQAALRELKEETGLTAQRIFVADYVSKFYEKHGDCVNLVPVFGIEVKNKKVSLSEEHCNFKWLSFKKAHAKLTWNGQKKGLKAVHSMLNSKDARMKWSKII
tara:strand:+ start:29 stop:487 length:459 start_codon:yes stop_codon:yes gene_type:complete